MGKHEKPVSGSSNSRKSEARQPRSVRTSSVREEELIFDVPDTAHRVSVLPAETPESSSPAVSDDIFGTDAIVSEEETAPVPSAAENAAKVQAKRTAPRAAEPSESRTADRVQHRRASGTAAEGSAKNEDAGTSHRAKKAASGDRSASERRNVKAEAGGESPKGKASPHRKDESMQEFARPAKKKRSFSKRLLTYAVILAVIFLAVLVVLWIFLAKFQKNKEAELNAEAEQAAIVLQEKQHAEEVRQAPQKAFEAWLASYTADDWTNLWYEKRPENIDGRDRVRSYMEERFSADSVAAYRSLDYTDETPVYVLKDGDETLAKITMTGSDVNWSVSDVELELEGTASASVKVATGSKVYCNGTELGTEYAGESESTFSYEPLKDTLENPVSWTTYTVDGLLIEPELTVEPPAGCSVTETAEGDFLLCLDGDEADQYINKAVSFVRAYLNYYMNGYNGTNANLWAALAYLTQGTQAYSDLQDSYNGVVWNTAYGNIDTSDTTASGVVIWADNCYSVDVTYDANCTYNGEAIDYADATMRIYFVKTNGTFIITNYETL